MGDPSSCGFGINLDLGGDPLDSGSLESQWGGDYINPGKEATPNRAKYFPNAHILGHFIPTNFGNDDNWLTLGCEFCTDAAEKEAAMGKWAIWQTVSNLTDCLYINRTACSDTLPTDGGAKLLATCTNCPAAGGSWPWSPKATWTAYGNATKFVKGSTTCCQQKCLDPSVCTVDWNPLKCAMTACCHFTDIGCQYVGKERACAPANGESLHVTQTIVWRAGQSCGHLCSHDVISAIILLDTFVYLP